MTQTREVLLTWKVVAIFTVCLLLVSGIGNGLFAGVEWEDSIPQDGCDFREAKVVIDKDCTTLRDLIDLIQGVISSLPDSDFKPPADFRKTSLINKFEAVYRMFTHGGLNGPVLKLLRDIRSKMDSSDGGFPPDDWIVDPSAQAVLLPLIDRLIDGDFDGDGLSLEEEVQYHTDPCDPDTDGDRLLDGEEIFGYETLQGTFITDPLNPDTDNDTAYDGHEVLDFHRYDRIENEDYYSSENATRFYTHVTQTANLTQSSYAISRMNLEMNIPWTGEYLVSVSGVGTVTFDNLNLSAATFVLDDLSSDIIVNSPNVTVTETAVLALPLIPIQEDRRWEHLSTDTQGTEVGQRLDQATFKAHVATFWVYEGEFNFTRPGQYNLSLSISLPPDASRIDPIFHPFLSHISTLKIETDFFRISRRTIDPLDPDVDSDTILDGFEGRNRMYPLNPDPDEDGISDPLELALETNDELRDTDFDGVRDGVEIGRDGLFDDPYTIWDSHPENIDGDLGVTTTDPLHVDTDMDGLPDGFIDGWISDDKKGWGRFGTPDAVRQRWEGEDFNRNGIADVGPWNMGQGPGETDPSNPDTDLDQLPEAWEVWYLLDPTSSVGDDGADGNPDHDGAVREHSMVRDTTTGIRWPYGRAQTFEASERTYDNLVIWTSNSPIRPFTEKLEVLVIGTKNGVPDPSVQMWNVATVAVPVGDVELNITLGFHSLTVGTTYALWFRQASQISTGILLIGFSLEGAELTGSVWQETTTFLGSFFYAIGDGEGDLYFRLLKWGGVDQLSNLGEYIVGSHPRDPDTDGDGAGDWPEAQVMYRTNVPNGGKAIDEYGSVDRSGGYEWIWFNNKEYGFKGIVENPPVGFVGASADNILVALLRTGRFNSAMAASIVVSEDGRQIFVWESSHETAWHRTFFMWERTGRTYNWSSFADSNSNGVIDSTVFVYSVGKSRGLAKTDTLPLLSFKDKEIYLSDPFSARSDWDRFPDRYEPLWFQDVDLDGLSNARDTDSDGDGVGDDNEARFIWKPPELVPLNDVDGDGLDNLVDPDSDGDGVEDGLEYLFYMDLDWDGYKNMVDIDIDSDGIPDGWMDGYRYDNASGTFIYDALFADGIIQSWEGEDTNLNGVFEPLLGETDPTNPDSDGDLLWDGNNVDVLIGRYSGFHYGELDIGTDSLDNDTDGDGILDGVEVYGWYSGYWSPPRLMRSDPLNVNTDGDLLSDYLEYTSRLTDPSNTDTDGDRLSDGQEDANQNGRVDPGETWPNRFDSDHDGLNDGLEVGLAFWDSDPSTTTNPVDPDTDGDGLIDGLEDANRNGRVEGNEADPNDSDSDNDGIEDGPEYRVLGNIDRDDGIMDINDLWRNASGTWVLAWFLDFDGDFWVNALDSDSDNDGWDDGVEDGNKNGIFEPHLGETNPLNGDEDEDGAFDGIEASYGVGTESWTVMRMTGMWTQTLMEGSTPTMWILTTMD
jgi:hypothetical protein